MVKQNHKWVPSSSHLPGRGGGGKRRAVAVDQGKYELLKDSTSCNQIWGWTWPKCTVFLRFSVRWEQTSGFVLASTSLGRNIIRSHVFFLLRNLSPTLPSWMFLFRSESWSVLWSGGNTVPSLLMANSLQRTPSGGARFNLVPRAFPWVNRRGRREMFCLSPFIWLCIYR